MKPLNGSMTALITPFRDGAVDEAAFQRLVDRQAKGGTIAVIPVGTTGESATLTHEEHRRVIALAVEAAAGRMTVIAGAGSNATAEAIEIARFAEGAGADALGRDADARGARRLVNGVSECDAIEREAVGSAAEEVDAVVGAHGLAARVWGGFSVDRGRGSRIGVRCRRCRRR